ncbi:MAG TPA: alternative ribosome rescue aminoacyl-tRNA hydrolase ArfB [Tepidisphaeraceae bacterium]|jgi:ribosome-associated protein|nr:alternative ribosome rescue aminoacyl-tRNA hydrolase ArfB [Tepidisphaeraceae bacterium]
MTEPDDHFAAGGVELAPGVRVPESALRWQFARSSGPGGQNVNKVNTKAELWLPLNSLALSDRVMGRLRGLAGRRLTSDGEIHVSADTERTQEANRAAVLERLRDLLVQAIHEPKPRRKTKPTRASKQRRLESKRRRSQVKARRRGQE